MDGVGKDLRLPYFKVGAEVSLDIHARRVGQRRAVLSGTDKRLRAYNPSNAEALWSSITARGLVLWWRANAVWSSDRSDSVQELGGSR